MPDTWVEQKKKTDLMSYLNYSDSFHIVILSCQDRKEEESRNIGDRNQKLLAHIYKILAFRRLQLGTLKEQES